MPERPSEFVGAGRLLAVLTLLVGLASGFCGCHDSATGDYRAYDGASEDSQPAEPAQSTPESEGSENGIGGGGAGEVVAVNGAETSDDSAAAESVDSAGVEAANGSADPAVPTEETQVVAHPAAPEAAPSSGDPAAPAGEATPAGPLQVSLLVPERDFKVEGPEGALRISYDDFDLLKILNMDPVTTDAPNLLPHWLKDLDGKRVRVRGFMYPPFQETDIPVFVLARDNQICCFGRNPKVYDLVKVAMRQGTTTHYIQGRPFDVVGVFHIRPEVEDGELYRLYEIDDAVVIE